MATSEIATLPGYEQFGPWLLVEKSGHVHAVSTNRRQRRSAPCIHDA
jgi:enoyl-CoA hydratase